MKPILLIRANSNEADANALKEAGIPSAIEPFLEISLGSKIDAESLLQSLQIENAWVVVTSRNAVESWGRLVTKEKLAEAFSNNSSLKFAAVGDGSAEVLSELGARNVQQGIEKSGQGLLGFLLSKKSETAIIPLGSIAMRTLPEGLEKSGWKVVKAVTYINQTKTVPDSIINKINSGDYSAVVLRSPSAARALHLLVPETNLPLLCGGDQTAKEVESLGMKVAATTHDPSPEGIASMALQFFNSNEYREVNP